jgi:cytochrome P450
MTRASISIPNLVDPNTYAEHDMADIWRRLRSEDPVHWHPETAAGPGFWVVSRYENIVQVLRDDVRFTSERGNVLTTLLQGGDIGAGRMLAVSDGHHHTELRKLLIQAFGPRALEEVTRRVRQSIRRLLCEAVDRGNCDFAKDVASFIPLETICDLLDVPIADRPEILRLTKTALTSDESDPEAIADRRARNEIMVYFSDLVEERRKSPGSDPISLMATATFDGKYMPADDIILNCYSLILGGNQTSRLTMIEAVHAFIRHPDQWRALKKGSVDLASACEEVLRWATPAMHFGRVAITESELCGKPISPGDLVTLWFTSANRDEAEFQDADRFDLARSPNRHLALGYGRHFCIGASLGRIEITAMLDGLRAFVSHIEQAGSERRIYSNFLSGMSSLPVVLGGDRGGQARWQELWCPGGPERSEENMPFNQRDPAVERQAIMH